MQGLQDPHLLSEQNYPHQEAPVAEGLTQRMGLAVQEVPEAVAAGIDTEAKAAQAHMEEEAEVEQ